jgi:hypothetical protein
MRPWSLTELLIFLNEFGKNWSIRDCARTYPAAEERAAYCQFTFDHNKSETYGTVRVIIPEKGCGIRVDASASWVEQKWKNEIIPASLRFDKVDSCRHEGDWR